MDNIMIAMHISVSYGTISQDPDLDLHVLVQLEREAARELAQASYKDRVRPTPGAHSTHR